LNGSPNERFGRPLTTLPGRLVNCTELRSFGFLRELFRQASADETIQPPDETISCFRRRRPETPVGYQLHNEKGGQRRPKSGDSQMRTFSFILAFAFVMVGPSLAGSSDTGLPGVGTFTYHGSPIVTSVPRTVLVASL
jgi:hypothetical protein